MDLGFLKTFRRLLILGILLGVFFVSLTSGVRPAKAAVGTNQTINFQGRLLTSTGAAVPDGYYNIQFKIYQDGDGLSVGNTTGSPTGSLKWTESYLNSASQGVRVFNGYMSVQLGSVNAFGGSVDWNQSTLWLSMNVGNTNASCTPFTSCSPDGEMTPMQPLTSAVYALNSSQLGGLTAAAFGQLAATQTWTAANIFQPTGNVTGVKILQTSAGAPTADIFNVQSANNTNLIQVTGPSANNAAITLRSLGAGNAITLNSAGALNFTGAAASVWDIGNNTLSLQTTNNGAITTGSGLLTVGGSQTFSGANPVISASTTNTNLTVQTNGTGTVTINTTGAGTVNVGTSNTTTVGIGNNGASTAVTTTGGATTQTVANGGVTVKTNTNSATAFQVQNASNAAALLVDTTTQRVGIGTSAPVAALEVSGDIYLTKEAARTIKVDTSTTASTAGGALTIAAGTGNAANGGALTLSGGGAINSAGSGGNVAINGGNAASGSVGAGGNVTITGGVGAAVGNITLQGGTFFNNYGAVSLNTTGNGKLIVGSNKSAVQIDTSQNLITSGSNVTSAALATPVISTVSTGSSFYYGITAYNGQGETLLSNTVGMASSSSTITWTAVAGASGYKIYRNTTNNFTSGSLLRATTTVGFSGSYTDDGSATGAGLPPTSSVGTKTVLQAWNGQTGDIQQWQNSAGTVLANVTAGGIIQAQSGLEVASTGALGAVEKFRVNTPTTVDSLANSILTASAATSKALVIQGAASQSANLQEWQSSAGTVQSAVDASGNHVFGASASAASGVIRLQNNTSIAWRNAANSGDKLLRISSSNVTDALDTPGNIVVGGSDATAGALYFFNANVVVKRTAASGLQLLTTGTTGIVLNQTGQVGIAPSSTTFTGGTVEKLRVNNPTTADNLANVIFGTNATTNKGLVIQGLASQSGNLQEWQDSTGAALASVSSAGNLVAGTINTNTFGASALTFSGANPVISASTTNTGLTLQSNGTGTLTLNSTGAGTVNVGTTNTTTVGIGNSTAATTVTSTGGATVQTVANAGATIKTNTNSISGFQVQNSSSAVIFNVDTSTGAVGTVSTSTASTASQALSLQSGATTGTTSNSGNVTLASGAASTSGNSGTLTLKTGDAGVGNSGSITLDVGTAPNGTLGTITIGGTNARSTTIGNATGTNTVSIQAGTGNLSIQTQGTGTLGIGNNAVAQNLAIGNGTGATTVGISCGTGACTFGSNATAHATTIGSLTGASATTVQSGTGNLNIETQGTGSLNIGNNAVAQTINIGNGTGATAVSILCGTGACGFGNNAVAHSTTIGSLTGAAATTIQSGTGNLSIQTQGTGTLGIGNNAVAQTLVLGNSTGATSVAINCGTGACTLGSNATDHSTTVGSTTGTSVTTIQGGSGGVVINSNTAINGTVNTNTFTASALTFSGANPVISASTTNTNLSVQANGTGTLTLNSTGAGTVNVGTANTTTVGIGNTTAATTTSIAGGTGANAVSIQSGSGGTISIGTATAGNTIQIGSITGNVTQTIGIGNNATATSVNNVTIGSLLTSSSTLIQGGTGASAIVLAQGTGGGITIGGTGAASTVQIQCGAGTATTCGFANNATDHTTYIGSLAGTSVTNIQSGLGGISLTGNVTTSGTINTNTFSSTALTFTGANPVISTTSTNSNFTLQANGTGTLTLNTSGAGTVNVGTTNTTTVAVGNTSGGATVTLTGGATTTTVANAGTTIKTSTNSTTALQVQNAAGAAILEVNTSTPQVSFIATAVNATNGTPLVNTSYTSTNTTAGIETAQSITVSDTGVTTSNVDTTTGLNLSVTHTGQTGGQANTYGIALQVNTDNAGSGTAVAYGLNGLVVGSADTGVGVAGGFLAAGNTTTTTAIGTQGAIGTYLFGGTVTNAIGVNAYISSTGGAGTLTNGYGIQVASASVGAGGSIGANYGIQVQPQTVGSTNYGVAIGTASTQTLQVGYDADGTTANAGISFGATAGTAANLYRGANNQLKTDSSFLVKTTTDSTSALSVQNAAGTNIFAVDTINGTVGTVKTTTASTPSQALNLQSGTVVGTGSSSGNVTLQSGASTVSGNTGNLTLASGNATSGNSGSITIDVGSATGTFGSLNIGTTNAQTIGVGNTTAGTAVTIQGGTGASAITLAQGTGGAITIGGSGAASTVAVLCGAGTSSNCGFANNATDHSTAIGSSTGTSATTVQGGSGGLTLSAGTINLNSATISTNQASVSFLNTTATTVTALQAATSISMGATSGTLTLRNANIVLGNAAGSGSLTNNGGTTNITLPLGDFPAGGSIGTNSSTVDIYTSISVNQSTAGRTLTIPTPTNNITYGRLLYLSNIGSVSFTVGSATISAGTTATLVWSNTSGGATWQFAGADAASILNQNSLDQTANFRISGTGRANTSFTAPLFDSISGAVGLGTTTATGVNIGNGTGSTSVSASCGTGTCGFGNNATDHTTAIGSGTGVSATTINGGSGGIQAKATGTTAFQVQNASGTSVLTVDTTNRQLKVMENAGSTNYALIYYDTATTTANYTASSGTVAVGTGAGSISIQAGTASTIAITANAASLWRTTAGTLTLQSGTNSNLILTPTGTGMATISGSAKFVLGQSAGDPGTCTVGALVYNTTTNALRGCQGSTPTWNDIINVTTPTAQATYTASTGGATAEIKLDTTRGALDIQGDNAGAVTDLFNIRAGTGSGLGQSLFNVASSGDVTIQSSAGIAELATTNTDVTIGQGATAHAADPIVLILDNYQPITAGGAPTQQDGAMYYNADQNIFMCGVAGVWTNCAINSIQSSYVFEDEFLGGTTSAATGTSFQGVGALGWNVNATTSCAAAYNQTGPALTHDHPGTLRLTTGGASGNGCAMTQAGTAAGTATLSQIIGVGDVFKTSIAIGAQTGTMRVGWTNQTSNTAPTSGAWWEYVNGSDATHLRYCYANNGGATCAAGPVIAANTWAELEIYINATNNITFVTNINGTTTSVTTTNTFDPGTTNKLGPTTTCYASSATPLNCYVDYIQWSGVNTSTHGVRD